MPSYAHNKLVQKIKDLDQLPTDPAVFDKWIEAARHLRFLQENGRDEEVVIYASGPYAFIHSMIVPNNLLNPPDEVDLLGWSCNPYTSFASYVTGGGREGMWVERGPHGGGSKTLGKGMNLIYGRDFRGWSGPDSTYFEIAQEYTHLSDIHWRPEERAYCRFDDNGDLHHSVSVTVRKDDRDEVSLVSFDWKLLEEYLAATDNSLVRMYDFTLLDREKFNGWPDSLEQTISNGSVFFYRQKICPGVGAYTRGIQILGLRGKASEILKGFTDGWFGKGDRQHAEFIAHDWRNKVVTKISTDPLATTNYFNAGLNNLPFELSPAFFKPEVLLKYKTDRDKYTVEDRSVTCRAAWYLRGYDVNRAGQVHVYICDLRSLPYNEQLHWLSFNEPPKEGISERAYINDFKGEWTKTTKPLQKVLSILRRWNDRNVPWWASRESGLFDRVTVPYSASRDEWADSFMDLAKLVNEGFEAKFIRKRLDAARVEYNNTDGSIALLEKLASHEDGDGVSFTALRTVQRIRSKVKGHSGSSEAESITRDALASYESFAKHFEFVADNVSMELGVIEKLFSNSAKDA
ncbi:MAG TPA: hypothetical protein VGT78_05375 [Rhizomicrobium sp.]|nr:hypothetical protein [Rhizomicrobium sp.]